MKYEKKTAKEKSAHQTIMDAIDGNIPSVLKLAKAVSGAEQSAIQGYELINKKYSPQNLGAVMVMLTYANLLGEQARYAHDLDQFDWLCLQVFLAQYYEASGHCPFTTEQMRAVWMENIPESMRKEFL